MSSRGVAAKVAAAEQAAGMSAAKVLLSEFAQDWPEWHIWLTREARSIVATRIGVRHPDDDGRWARTVIADDLDTLERELTEQRSYQAVQM